MSPDGRALLYLDRPRDWREPVPVRLMRVSTAERFPQFVLQTSGYSEWGLRFECAQIPGGPCILAQRTGNEIVFGRFDSERGYGSGASDVLKIQLEANLKISWALVHVASLRQPGSDRNTSQGRESEVVLTHLSHLHALNSSPDGEGWYVTTHRLFWPPILSAIFGMATRIVAERPRTPKPPVPELITIAELPLPPAAPSTNAGACTAAINPNRTGCIDPAPMTS